MTSALFEKLITDFKPGTPKYVFSGIKAFAANPPIVVTGDDYQSGRGVQGGDLFRDTVVINILNIAKLTAKDKGHLAADDAKAKVARIRRLADVLEKESAGHEVVYVLGVGLERHPRLQHRKRKAGHQGGRIEI